MKLRPAQAPNPLPTPEIIWSPLPGSQTMAMDSRANYTLYHGSRGPGKTLTQLMRFLRHVGKGYGKHWRGVIFNCSHKSLDNIVAESKIWIPKLKDGAEWLASASQYMWRWPTGEVLMFRHANKEDDYDEFHGMQIPWIGFDELTKHASPAFHDKVMSTNRSGFDPIADTPKDDYGNYLTPDGLPLPPIPLEVFSTTNSSGVGRNWVKRRFIDPAPSGTMVKTVVDVYNPKTKQREPFTKTQIAIFGSYKENPYLDPQYVAGLETERDPNLRRSWLLGDWNVTSGGALDDLWDDNIHILEPFQIPESWYIDRSYDNGTLHPFSVGFWAEADGTEATIVKSGRVYKWGPPPGTLIQIAEYYGSEEIGTNKGIGLASKTIAQNIKEIEAALKRTGLIKTDVRAGAADNKIRDTNPDADNMEKIMQKEGVYWLPSDKSSGSRAVGLQLFRERLENSKKDEGPGIYFFRTCRASIQTIPCLPRDTKKLDDVDTTAEDHAYDMARYRILQSKRGSSVSFKVRLPT